MKVLSCTSTRRRLQAFHDHELPVAEQIAVEAHLEWCGECANEHGGFRLVGAALREAAPGRLVLAHDDPGFSSGVVNRLKVEADQAFIPRVREMFDDMHFVYAGLGSVVATAACLMIVFGMMRFATIAERPDSLAAIMNLLASPGSNENPVSADPNTIALPIPDRFRVQMSMPVALDAAISAGAAGDGDAFFAMAAVVTREGRIQNLDLLNSDDGGQPILNEDHVVEGIMSAMSRTRFQPAQRQGLPVAVNIVWVVANTTVRGTIEQVLAAPVAAPLIKKKTVSIETVKPILVG